MIVLADVAILPLSMTFGWLFGLLSLIPVIVLESYLLRRMQWGDLRASLMDAGLANVFSTIAGVLFIGAFSTSGFRCGRVPAGDGEHFLTSCGWQISPFIGIVLMYLFSVLIEGLVLWIRRKDKANLWRASFLMNLGSYLLLTPFLLAMMWMG
jgi:Na+/phosphate symporter